MSKLILLVDDQENDRVIVERVLRRLGVANPILHFDDGEDAIHYLAGEGVFGNRALHPLPHILLLDLKMPRKSGFEVLQWIKEHPVGPCLILVISELHALADIKRAYQLGANSFLSKPLDEAEIRECLRNHPECWDFKDPRSFALKPEVTEV
jgi:CheY-like chemotaxis protein